MACVPTIANPYLNDTSVSCRLRDYQSRMVETVMRENTIILLPTGAGKTAIAASTISRFVLGNSASKALFFVPTIALVSQQANALREWIEAPVCKIGQFHGDKSFPEEFTVLVTTPKAFESALLQGSRDCMWSNFSVIVFDEVHHAIKDHPYRSLAMRLGHSNCHPRIIGLTASLTYAVGEAKVQRASQRLCSLLQISRIEVADEQELKDGGYAGPRIGSVAEVNMPSAAATATAVGEGGESVGTPENSNVVGSDCLCAQGGKGGGAGGGGAVPIIERKPHLMHKTFFQRLSDGTCTTFASRLMECVAAVERDVQMQDPGFVSPLRSSVSLKSWGNYAKSRAQQSPFLYASLESWYEATRILITSWEGGEDQATIFLRMMKGDYNLQHPQYSIHTREVLSNLFSESPTGFERFDRLYQVVEEKFENGRDQFRGIIFVKQRVTAHILQHSIASRPLVSNNLLRPAIIYAASTPATPSLKLSASQVGDALCAFGDGRCNLMIATSVVEEGLDVPAANCVIYFDAIDTSVSYVQGRGRARQENSSFVMMTERPDRPAATLARMELEQHAIATTFQPTSSLYKDDQEASAQQRSREIGSHALLGKALPTCIGGVYKTSGAGTTTAAAAIAGGGGGGGGGADNPVAVLNIYCKKTKALCDESYQYNTLARGTTAQTQRPFYCELRYQSDLRTIVKDGWGETKKLAKRRAAFALLQQLYIDTKHPK